MKFQYLGTAAAEGIPALFCTCENCRRAREAGGRSLRSRSQAVIDDTLLLDFPADTYDHTVRFGLDLSRIQACLFTHSHRDHLYPGDFEMLADGFSHMQQGYHLACYGGKASGELIAEIIAKQTTVEKQGLASYTVISPFAPFSVGKYTVTALPAIHDPKSAPLIYLVTDGEKTMLYGHDTDFFPEEIWDYFAKVHPHFDLVSLDCTNMFHPMTYVGHMNLELNVKIRGRMLEKGYADANTKFVCNHFSHNGGCATYDAMAEAAAKEGFTVSYDGMIIEI